MYKGVDSVNERPVAIKTVRLSESVVNLELVKKEARHLQLIDNDNVVKLFDVKMYIIY